MFSLILIAVVSYGLGSIPFGYILVRIFRGEDVRQSGSGNIGATNVARKSPVLGAITLVLDAAKGAGAVLLVIAPFVNLGASVSYRIMSLAALCAVVGHMFPVWLKFRGGKGVATALGSFALIAPKAVLAAAAIFIVLVLIFRYISLGSIVAVAAFPILAWVFHEYGNSRGALAFMAVSSLLIIARHHANIRRLIAGTEHRFRSRRSSESTAAPTRSPS
jgi:acyl phosphate:glycerol-3-phosphate acyltransferase